MEEVKADAQGAIIQFTFEEICVLLQCVIETHDHRSEGDISAIIGITKKQLGEFGEELENLTDKINAIRGSVGDSSD